MDDASGAGDDLIRIAERQSDDAARMAERIAEEEADDVAKYIGKGGSGTKPEQLHHFATNKNKTYTPQFEEIANKYGLDLDDAWNKEYMLHQGRHPNEYHDYVLDSMTEFDKIAQGDKNVFIKLYDNLKKILWIILICYIKIFGEKENTNAVL